MPHTPFHHRSGGRSQIASARASRRLVRRRGHPRRLRTPHRRHRVRLRHPVRALEGHLEFAQRRQLLRTGPRARPAQHDARHVRPADLPRQPRRDPHRQPPEPERAPSARPRAPADHRWRPVHLRGRRIRFRRCQGGTPRRGRRDTTGLPRTSRRGPGLRKPPPSPLPRPDRSETAPSMACPRPNHGRHLDQYGSPTQWGTAQSNSRSSSTWTARPSKPTCPPPTGRA